MKNVGRTSYVGVERRVTWDTSPSTYSEDCWLHQGLSAGPVPKDASCCSRGRYLLLRPSSTWRSRPAVEAAAAPRGNPSPGPWPSQLCWLGSAAFLLSSDRPLLKPPCLVSTEHHLSPLWSSPWSLWRTQPRRRFQARGSCVTMQPTKRQWTWLPRGRLQGAEEIYR